MINKKIKKIFLSFTFIFIFLFVFTIKADALCTTKRYSNLKMIAYKSEVSYELNFDEKHNYYFLLTVNNVDKDIIVIFEGNTYKPVDGVIKIPTKIYGGKTYEVNLYGGFGTYCPEEFLYAKKITVPKYNVYSEREECIEYEEFYLCNKWYAGSIANERDFLNQLNVYINSLKKPDDNIPKNEKGLIQKIIDFYLNYKIITIPITVALVLFAVYKIVIKIIRRRNRIKLNQK